MRRIRPASSFVVVVERERERQKTAPRELANAVCSSHCIVVAYYSLCYFSDPLIRRRERGDRVRAKPTSALYYSVA